MPLTLKTSLSISYLPEFIQVLMQSIARLIGNSIISASLPP